MPCAASFFQSLRQLTLPPGDGGPRTRWVRDLPLTSCYAGLRCREQAECRNRMHSRTYEVGQEAHKRPHPSALRAATFPGGEGFFLRFGVCVLTVWGFFDTLEHPTPSAWDVFAPLCYFFKSSRAARTAAITKAEKVQSLPLIAFSTPSTTSLGKRIVLFTVGGFSGILNLPIADTSISIAVALLLAYGIGGGKYALRLQCVFVTMGLR